MAYFLSGKYSSFFFSRSVFNDACSSREEGGKKKHNRIKPKPRLKLEANPERINYKITSIENRYLTIIFMRAKNSV